MNPTTSPSVEIERFFRGYYVPQVLAGIRQMDTATLKKVSDKIAHRVLEGKRIFCFGNGGSDAMSEAMALAMFKRMGESFPFDIYSNPKLSEAVEIANSCLFNPRLKRSGRAGDLAILISASGNSENINNASALCRDRGIETVSISGNGRVANDPATRATVPLVVYHADQQILEDISFGIMYLLVDIAGSAVGGREITVEEVEKIKNTYVDALAQQYQKLLPARIESLAASILNAFHQGKQIRIDAPENGLLTTNALHMQHNFKWDSWQNVKNRLPNRIQSGLPMAHLTGVGNDGGDGFNYAIEVSDNYEEGDVEVLFAQNQGAKKVKSLRHAAQTKGMDIHEFAFEDCSEYIASNMAQSILHLTARVINATLLAHEGTSDSFRQQLGVDLALLRQKEEIRTILEKDNTLNKNKQKEEIIH